MTSESDQISVGFWVGRYWIDVAAPTVSTSDATAVGGGLAALMVAANPGLTPESIRAAFRAGVDVLSTTQGKVNSNVRPTPLSLNPTRHRHRPCLCWCGTFYHLRHIHC